MRNDKLLKKILKNTHRTSFDFENEYVETAFDEAIKIKNKEYDNLEDFDEVKFYKFNPHDNGKLNVFIDFDNSRSKKVRMYIFDMDGLLISESGSEYNQALCNSIDVVDNNDYLIAVEAVKGSNIDYSLKVKNYTNYEDYMENVEDNDLGSKYEIDDDYKFWELDDKRNFKYGKSGIMVVELERALFKLGYINEELSQDGYFGETIKDALEEFKDDYEVSSEKGQVNDDVVDALEIAMLERRKIISIGDVELKEPQFRPHTYYKAFEVEVENSSEERNVKDLKIIVEDEDGELIAKTKTFKIRDGEKEVYKAIVKEKNLPEGSGKNVFNIKIVSDEYEDIVFDNKRIDVRFVGVDYEDMKEIGEKLFDGITNRSWLGDLNDVIEGLKSCKDKNLNDQSKEKNKNWTESFESLVEKFYENTGLSTDTGILGLVMSAEAKAIFGLNAGTGIYMNTKVDKEGNPEWVQTLEGQFIIESNIGAGLCVGLVYYPFLSDLEEVLGFCIELGFNYSISPILSGTVSINQCRPETLAFNIAISTLGNSILPHSASINTGYAIEVDSSKYDNMIVGGSMTRKEWRDFMYHDIWHHSRW